MFLLCATGSCCIREDPGYRPHTETLNEGTAGVREGFNGSDWLPRPFKLLLLNTEDIRVLKTL